jgi:hypothetical protein
VANPADPGIEPTAGLDRPLVAAIIFVALGFMPNSWVEAALTYAYFGPVAWTAILCMVGVLFAVIALLRSLDLEDQKLRNAAIVLLLIGLARLFILPAFVGA